jgi:hypothetical protein
LHLDIFDQPYKQLLFQQTVVSELSLYYDKIKYNFLHLSYLTCR